MSNCYCFRTFEIVFLQMSEAAGHDGSVEKAAADEVKEASPRCHLPHVHVDGRVVH